MPVPASAALDAHAKGIVAAAAARVMKAEKRMIRSKLLSKHIMFRVQGSANACLPPPWPALAVRSTMTWDKPSPRQDEI
jgi:hypothetical protein